MARPQLATQLAGGRQLASARVTKAGDAVATSAVKRAAFAGHPQKQAIHFAASASNLTTGTIRPCVIVPVSAWDTKAVGYLSRARAKAEVAKELNAGQ
jgi:hypothetical protein